jgi:hypothetical protein
MLARTFTLFLVACMAVALLFAQSQTSPSRRWAQYEDEMQTPVEDPPGAYEKTEFAFARLRFRTARTSGYYQRWGIDANRADRNFSRALSRLTRVQTRSVEQIVDIDSDDIFDWPFLYAVSIGDWVLSDSQAQRLREFFLRGGFLMVDDFHSEPEWRQFMAGISRVLPESHVIDIADSDPIFQVVYDLSRRVRVPGYNVVFRGQVERGGADPHWRAVIDQDGIVQVAICFNMDLGDAFEFADDPGYPEQYASMAFRMGVNYVIYAMTH